METVKDKILKIFELVGFERVQLEESDKDSRISIRIKDKSIADDRVPELVGLLTHLAKQVARKEEGLQVLVDINDYRKEREDLIIKLARAAAKKAATTKERVPLPSMNA
jgi:predicted RNA-binding protein Jag